MIPFKGKRPKIHQSAYIAMYTIVAGDVTIGKDSSIWFGSVLRADVNSITIGDNTNIQDNSTIHMGHEKPVIIGDRVSVGHNCIIHGCQIHNNVIVGMGTTLLDGAEIASNSIIGANSLVTSNKKFPQGVLIMGSPARVIRDLSQEEIESIDHLSREYSQLANDYRN